MKKNKAFTLIELLVVIAIIGILATLVIVRIGNARGKSVISSAKSDISNLSKSVELFKRAEGLVDGSVIPNSASSVFDTLNSTGGPSQTGQPLLSTVFTGTASIGTTANPAGTYGAAVTKTPGTGVVYVYKANIIAANRKPAVGCYVLYAKGLDKVVTTEKAVFYVQDGSSGEATTDPSPKARGTGTNPANVNCRGI
jgi:prepilin-type N-terminal cleavage/methylation domain-containing protein